MGFYKCIAMCEINSSSYPVTPTSKKQITQIFPAFLEVVLEKEGQTDSKGSWIPITGATRPSMGGL